jgi:hypothetical protein
MSLEKELLENELAYKYSGGKKSSWCNWFLNFENRLK